MQSTEAGWLLVETNQTIQIQLTDFYSQHTSAESCPEKGLRCSHIMCYTTYTPYPIFFWYGTGFSNYLIRKKYATLPTISFYNMNSMGLGQMVRYLGISIFLPNVSVRRSMGQEY